MLIKAVVSVLMCALTVFLDGVAVSEPETCSVCKCDKNLLLVNCSHSNFTHIPTEPYGGMTVLLNMSSTRLRGINQSDFDKYENLKVLDLFNTSLTTNTVDPTVFSKIKLLEYLNLSNNEALPLTNISTNLNLFAPLVALKELKIYGNTGVYYNQDSYPDEALSKMKQLKVLWIDGLTNVTFGRSFLEMKSLTTIIIPGDIIQPPWRFCYTDIVDGMLENLIHVMNFTMRKCGITFVNRNAFQNMTNLVHLDLSYNKLLTINGISQTFESLGMHNKKLMVLILNSIENVVQMECGVTICKSVAAKIGSIESLKEIHVEYNALNGFEKGAIAKLPKSIEIVNARRNEFELGFYTFETYNMVNLKRIDLSFNFFADDTAIWHQDPPKSTFSAVKKSVRYCDAFKYEESQNKDGREKANSADSTTTDDIETEDIFQQFLSHIRFPSSGEDFSQHFAKLLTFENDPDRLRHHKQRNDPVCPQVKKFLPPGTITAYVPRNLEYLDVSHSRFAHPIPEFYFNESNVLRRIYASHSLLYCWDGPVYGLTRLEYLDLSFNLCTNVRQTFFDETPTLRNLSIACNFLNADISNDTDGRILKNLTKLETLNIAYNRLVRIPKNFLIHQSKLRQLNLTGNLLTKFDVEIGHMEQLESLFLDSNHISTLPKATRNNLTKISEGIYKRTGRPVTISLNDNHIQCYCNNLDFLKWVYDHMSSCLFLNVSISLCVYYNGTEVPVNGREDMGNLLDRMKRYCASYTNVIIAVSVLLCVIINVVVGIAVHRFRWKIRYWYYVASSTGVVTTNSGYLSLDSLANHGSRYKYDVYIVSVDEERAFVLDKMKSKLEQKDYRLFVQYDDIVPGQNKYSVIANAIHISRLVIFVISETCEQDHDWKIAMRMAHEESANRGEPIHFGVFVHHNTGTAYSSDILEMRRRSYLDYPGDNHPQKEQTFWLEIFHKVRTGHDTQVLSLDTDRH